jgi:hypothetical protein
LLLQLWLENAILAKYLLFYTKLMVIAMKNITRIDFCIQDLEILFNLYIIIRLVENSQDSFNILLKFQTQSNKNSIISFKHERHANFNF